MGILFLSSERINLVRYNKNHIPGLLELWNSGEATKFVGFPKGLAISKEKVIEFIGRENKNAEAVPSKASLGLAVELKDGTFIGETWIGKVDEDKVSELDIKLLPKFQGKGYAREALHLVIDFTFKHSDCEEIQVSPNVENKRALNLYKHMGFKRVGRAKTWHNPSDIPGATDVKAYTYHLSRFDWGKKNSHL